MPAITMGFWRRLLDDESGQDLIEYALLCTFVALVGGATWDLVRGAINTTYTSWNTGMNAAWEPPPPAGP